MSVEHTTTHILHSHELVSLLEQMLPKNLCQIFLIKIRMTPLIGPSLGTIQIHFPERSGYFFSSLWTL